MDQEWRNGLFSNICGADTWGMCMGSWFCTPCLFSRVDDRLQKFPEMERDNLTSCNGAGFLLCGASYCHLGWVPLLIKRGDVRNRFGIRGDGCTDCLASYFCTPCTVAQMETELKDRATLAQSHVAKGGYDASTQPGMVYQPPQ